MLEERKSGKTWRVLSYALTADLHQCIVLVELVTLLMDEDNVNMAEITTQTITLPSIDWKCVYIPGSSDAVTISYLNQQIPLSLWQQIPIDIPDSAIILGNHSWMASFDANTVYRKLDVRNTPI